MGIGMLTGEGDDTCRKQNKPLSFPGPSSRFLARRICSGDLLMLDVDGAGRGGRTSRPRQWCRGTTGRTLVQPRESGIQVVRSPGVLTETVTVRSRYWTLPRRRRGPSISSVTIGDISHPQHNLLILRI
eukprot:758194-Hanusia_phi.AAC.1